MEVLRDILEQHEFEVATATDGEQAVEEFRREPEAVRVVILDQTMPRMNGIEAFEKIRAIDASAVVLLMSGFSNRNGDELACLESGRRVA